MKPKLLLAAAFFVGACAAARGAEMDVSYGPRPEQKLDVCNLEGATAARPAVLLIHGGGWSKGSRLDGDHQCEAFLRHGFIAVPVDYRLAGNGPDTDWPAQIEDVQLAMRWVRAHAGTLGIDPKRICALGASAGGHLALLLGTVRPIEPGDMAGILPAVSPQADCVVSIAGPTDLHALAQVRPEAVALLTGPVDARTQAVEEARGSPALRAGKDAAPALLIQGSKDQIVPYAQATEMQHVLTGLGVPVWLISHGGTHAMQNISIPEHRGIWKAIFTFLTNESLPGQSHSLNSSEIAVP